MDLYRLQGGADLRVLDIPGVLATSVCLIEWPDRLGAARPINRLGEKLALSYCCLDDAICRRVFLSHFSLRHPMPSLSSFPNRTGVMCGG